MSQIVRLRRIIGAAKRELEGAGAGEMHFVPSIDCSASAVLPGSLQLFIFGKGAERPLAKFTITEGGLVRLENIEKDPYFASLHNLDYLMGFAAGASLIRTFVSELIGRKERTEAAIRVVKTNEARMAAAST